MALVTSGRLLPATLLEELVTLDAKSMRERPFGPLLLLVGAPLQDESGAFMAALEKSVERHKPRAPEPSGWMSTAEFPTLGVEPGEPSGADQIELLAELGSAAYCIVPLMPTQGNTLTLGRSLSADIVTLDPSVSSKQAHFILEDGGIRIVDAQSKNGTLVNGHRIEPGGDGRWLQPMDRITFGRVSAFACEPRALRAVLRSDLKTLF